MTNSRARPRPSTLNECPIFRINRLFIGRDLIGRECWFGCLSADEVAGDHRINDDLGWYKVWAIDRSAVPNTEEILNITVVQEDANITKLLDRRIVDQVNPSLLGPRERKLRYKRLLKDIEKQKINVRSSIESGEFEIVQHGFVPQTQQGSIRVSPGGGTHAGGRRPKRAAGGEASRTTKKKKQKLSVDDDLPMHEGEDVDDDEVLLTGQQEHAEVKVEQEVEVSGHTLETVHEEAEVEQEVDVSGSVHEAVPEEAGSLTKERVSQLQAAIADLYNDNSAAPQREEIDAFLANAQEESQNGDGLDDPAIAIRFSRRVINLIEHHVTMACRGKVSQHNFITHVEHHHLPGQLKEAAEEIIVSLNVYIAAMNEKIERIRHAIQKVEESLEDDEEL